ncbi:MAG: hypothetical protein IMZ53_00455 [Thermoplasmata archaeon]|nr:hypothetical protein [Thermoplasmata archaeon]
MKSTELISLVLIIFACLMTFLIMLGLFFVNIPKENQQMVNIFSSIIISTCLVLVYNYRFGSSKGSADKNKLIADATKTDVPPAV